MSQHGDPTGGRRPEDVGAPSSSSQYEGQSDPRHGHRTSPLHRHMAAPLPMPGDPSRSSPPMEMPMGRGGTQPSPYHAHGAPPGVASLPSAPSHHQGGMKATAVTPESGQLGMAGLMSPPASTRKRRVQLTPGSGQAAMTISAAKRTGKHFRIFLTF